MLVSSTLMTSVGSYLEQRDVSWIMIETVGRGGFKVTSSAITRVPKNTQNRPLSGRTIIFGYYYTSTTNASTHAPM